MCNFNFVRFPIRRVGFIDKDLYVEVVTIF